MGLKAVTVHAHFYQPPREDPLSGLIPDETGAEPFRNWNERILSECYKPNAELGNYAKLSFNFGPTILNWMEGYDPETYHAIIDQERENFLKFGVGNGMAQAYNHTILPLANSRDKATQIKWGIADFVHRFGHQPMGMWLPETAVDLETLSILADNGIQYTILAPWQVKGLGNLPKDECYYVALPGNREPMIVFLYDQGLSTSVSFMSEATRNADYFVDRWINPTFSHVSSDGDRMLLIASDGELYGHHKIFREKFLAHMLNGALHSRDYEITYPGLWLQTHKPSRTVELIENTSWSCHHGVERWRTDCGCTPGATWKAPLRQSMKKLADEIDRAYDDYLSPLTGQIWELRDAYIRVLFGEISLSELFLRCIPETLAPETAAKVGMLLAAQYERQRMFTSCGWFFEHFHRIEPQNNIAYAAQAVWLTEKATGIDLRTTAMEVFKQVKDERTGLRGDTVFAERYNRSKDFSESAVSYFNPSSSFST
ncbi:MAG: DUF3536 domain-containing protein [Anaerolineaceae bacterium]|nr:DUF3536 domain-containing protein [Anaerolineaceae bacterium]